MHRRVQRAEQHRGRPVGRLRSYLCNETDARWVYGSHSIDDVNEGFDVIIQEEDGAGVYKVYLAWPEGAIGCDFERPIVALAATRWFP